LVRLSGLVQQLALDAQQEQAVTPTQARLLLLLANKGELRARPAAHELGIADCVVSEITGRLIQRGLVERTPRARGRPALLALTPEGRRTAGRVLAWRTGLSRAVAALSQSEQAALAAGLERLVRELDPAR